jgi:hypothetical protein
VSTCTRPARPALGGRGLTPIAKSEEPLYGSQKEQSEEAKQWATSS